MDWRYSVAEQVELSKWAEIPANLSGRTVSNLDELSELFIRNGLPWYIEKTRDEKGGFGFVDYTVYSRIAEDKCVAHGCSECKTIRIGPPLLEMTSMRHSSERTLEARCVSGHLLEVMHLD